MKWRPIEEMPEDMDEPVFTRRASPFVYGIAYKLPDGKGGKIWVIDAVVTDFLDPREDDEI